MDPILEEYYALEEQVKAYNPNLDTARLFSAFKYADNAHSVQLRKDGSPYITHPLAVAKIVAELGWTPTRSLPRCCMTALRTPAPP